MNTINQTLSIFLLLFAVTCYGQEKYMHSVKAHTERFEISGRFDGKTYDTLTISFAIDKEKQTDFIDHFKWVVRSAKGTVPSFNVVAYSPRLVFEGDLDGNGSDEFGILKDDINSAYADYDVFTWHNGKWCLLVDPIPTSLKLRASGEEIIRKSKEKGKVDVWMCDFYVEGSTFRDAPGKKVTLTPTYKEYTCLPFDEL